MMIRALDHNYHRYITGRYLTSDPIGLAGGFNSYAYANNRPQEFVDVWGLYAIGVWDGGSRVNIEIPVMFTGRANIFQERILLWKNVVERVYTGNFGNFNIKTKITIVNNNHKFKHINTIILKYDVECNPTLDDCNNHVKKSELLNEGVFFTSASDSTIAHEFGHILGIDFDPYFTVPHREAFSRWNNVMGSSLNFMHADWLMFSVIFDSKAFHWQGCKPQFEPYNYMLDMKDFERKQAESLMKKVEQKQ